MKQHFLSRADKAGILQHMLSLRWLKHQNIQNAYFLLEQLQCLLAIAWAILVLIVYSIKDRR